MKQGIYTATVNGGTPEDGFTVPANFVKFETFLAVGDFISNSGSGYIKSSPNGDMFIIGYHNLYKQTSGTGSFVSVFNTGYIINALCIDSEGSIYVGTFGGGIYKQTYGVGTFDSQTGVATTVTSICEIGSDIYSCSNSKVYKQTSRTGNFDLYRDAVGGVINGLIIGNSLGDIFILGIESYPTYTAINTLWKQTGGVGTYDIQTFTGGMPVDTRNAYMFMTKNNDLYLHFNSIDIYKQTNSTGNVESQTRPDNTPPMGIAEDFDGNVYISVRGRKIYKQTGGIGEFTAFTGINDYFMHICNSSDNRLYVIDDIDKYVYIYTPS